MNWKKLNETMTDEERRIVDVLAPHYGFAAIDPDDRTPIFERGHEVTPTPEDILSLARDILTAFRS